jgi:hypothetical protein
MTHVLAPIGHHWLDATHISFGVVTGAVYGRRWKAEGSAFNGREPDEQRYGFDLAPLDSYSGRLWLLPTRHLAIQVSAGHLTAAEARQDGGREDVTRVTASATYHRLVNDRLWATTIAWGRNHEAGGLSSPAFLAETSAQTSPRNTVFARIEVVGKTSAELAVPTSPDRVFAVAKADAGYIRRLAERHGMHVGAGGSAGVGRVPAELTSLYNGRFPVEASVFLEVGSQ